MARRKVRKTVKRRVVRKKPTMLCDLETHTKIIKHKMLCFGAFFMLVGAAPLMGYRWEYVAILFGLVTFLKALVMKKCC